MPLHSKKKGAKPKKIELADDRQRDHPRPDVEHGSESTAQDDQDRQGPQAIRARLAGQAAVEQLRQHGRMHFEPAHG